MTINFLDFEKPIAELEGRIEDLRMAAVDQVDAEEDIKKLTKKANELKERIFSNLTAWQKTQVARHQDRPNIEDYLSLMMQGFVEMHGDRTFADDPAIMGGMAWFDGKPVVVIGHHKGRITKDKIRRNFGMPHPEGYRKALRLMKFAEKFNRPILTFIDTAGAYPGIGAEERGQSEAIARNLFEMSRLKVPVVAVVIGEGGSGGALALGVANRVLMLEHSIYSVISPEGCAAILWKDGSKASEAAELLKLTAQDLKKLEVIDEVIKEPLGGAHRDYNVTAKNMEKALKKHLKDLSKLSAEELAGDRYNKFRVMGNFEERQAKA
ncbi:MAG TPA: acetyl-CoA carboxylase carboxyltransferase subunit alpha [Nitrospirota bacterium]|nr:acetyl-CoA carboxylase carboxyltransferase subunit alpha [Nitrospirota bacterium]